MRVEMLYGEEETLRHMNDGQDVRPETMALFREVRRRLLINGDAVALLPRELAIIDVMAGLTSAPPKTNNRFRKQAEPPEPPTDFTPTPADNISESDWQAVTYGSANGFEKQYTGKRNWQPSLPTTPL